MIHHNTIQSTWRRRRLSPRELHLSPSYSHMYTVTVYLHKALPPREAPITALTTVCPSAYAPLVCKPAEQSVTDNHAGRPLRMSAPDNRVGCLRRIQGFSATVPRTGLASGKLATRRICLSPVSAISRLRLPEYIGKSTLQHIEMSQTVLYS